MLISFFAYLLLRLLRATWRVSITGPDPGRSRVPLIFCFWHGDQAGLFAYSNPRPVVVMSSLSKDGALQARILRHLGFLVTRGSSSRGGAAGLLGMITHMRAGADAAFAVDGPRGPRKQAKGGAIEAAKTVGGLLIPISTICNQCWIFRRAWDRYRLPKPFARVELRRGPPLNPQLCDPAKLTNSLILLQDDP